MVRTQCSEPKSRRLTRRPATCGMFNCCYASSGYLQTGAVGWLDFIGAQNGEDLVVGTEFVTNTLNGMSLNAKIAFANARPNVVHKYNALISQVATAAPKDSP